MKGLAPACLFVFLACGVVVAQSGIDGKVDDAEYPDNASFGPVSLSWKVADGQLQMAVVGRTTGWVAVGFHPEQAMKGADMVFGWVDAEGEHALDCYATDVFGPHPPDTELGGRDDLIAVAVGETDGTTTAEFLRPLAAGDAYDKALVIDEDIRVVWAYGYSDDFNEYHAEAGVASISLSGGVASTPGRGLLLLHALLMSAGFSCMFTGMVLARYFKKTVKRWLKIHKLLGPTGGVLALAALAIAVYMIERTGGVHIKIWHAYVGIATIAGIVLTPVAGKAMLGVKKHKQQVRKAHRWLGRFTLLAMLATIALGILRALGVS